MAKAMARKTRPRKPNQNATWIIGGVSGAAILVLALVLFNLNSLSGPVQVATVLRAGRTLGKSDAPVTIDLYSDFQCPVCRRAEQMIRAIAPQYIDSGQVRVVYHNFAFIGPESEWSAQAAECANDQGKFWEYAYTLFDHQTGENVGAYSQANLKKFALDLQLDINTFNSCFDSGKYTALIQEEATLARGRGIQATPSFYVNERFVGGLLPTDKFTALLDSMLPKP